MSFCSLSRSVGIPATCGFIAISGFQLALAFGAPLSDYATAPTSLRCVSGMSSLLWIYAAVVLLHRMNLIDIGFTPEYTHVATYGLVAATGVAFVMACFSPSLRWTWGPTTLILAILCLILARTETDERSRRTERTPLEMAREPLLVVAVL